MDGRSCATIRRHWLGARGGADGATRDTAGARWDHPPCQCYRGRVSPVAQHVSATCPACDRAARVRDLLAELITPPPMVFLPRQRRAPGTASRRRCETSSSAVVAPHGRAHQVRHVGADDHQARASGRGTRLLRRIRFATGASRSRSAACSHTFGRPLPGRHSACSAVTPRSATLSDGPCHAGPNARPACGARLTGREAGSNGTADMRGPRGEDDRNI
jgi:hypothetical protein